MNGDRLFYESWQEAARDVIRAAGGTKAVSVLLWPAKPVTAAAQRLTDCLNPSRDEKLSLDEVLLLMRIGREQKCHALMSFIAQDTSYTPPVPSELEDEKTRLMRAFVDGAAMMKVLADRLEKHGLA